jgi:hypothetical protein
MLSNFVGKSIEDLRVIHEAILMLKDFKEIDKIADAVEELVKAKKEHEEKLKEAVEKQVLVEKKHKEADEKLSKALELLKEQKEILLKNEDRAAELKQIEIVAQAKIDEQSRSLEAKQLHLKDKEKEVSELKDMYEKLVREEAEKVKVAKEYELELAAKLEKIKALAL